MELLDRPEGKSKRVKRVRTEEVNLPGSLSIADLRQQIRQMEQEQKSFTLPPISTGFPRFDSQLPQRGLTRGTVIECLTEGRGTGVQALIVRWLQRASTLDGVCVVIDRAKQFYPPAAALWGLPLERTLILQPEDQTDMLWSLEQVLRSPAVAAVWAPLEQVDERWLRRLQLAAESSGALGILERPSSVRNRPTWADLQFSIQPVHHQSVHTIAPSSLPYSASSSSSVRPQSSAAGTELGTYTTAQTAQQGWRLRLELTRSRHGSHQAATCIEIDEASGMMREISHDEEKVPVRLASQLAHSANSRCAAGA